MKNEITPELIEKARQAQSVEELIALAEENDITVTENEARDYLAQLHESCNKSGELSDEELDNVSGGGCHVKVDGKKYTVVTCNTKCFTGGYFYHVNSSVWEMFTVTNTKHDTHRCGTCYHLKFKAGTGYCDMSGK